MTTSRRMFLQVMSSGMFVTVAACRARDDGAELMADPVALGDDPEVITVTLQDILTEGWSTLGSGFLGFNGPLKAQLIKENKTTTLPYVQDPHGHKFTLTPDHFAKLRKGQPVEVTTTVALGHRHIVKINPARKIAASQPITMPVEIASGDLPAAQPSQPVVTQPVQPTQPAQPVQQPQPVSPLPSLSNAVIEPG